jgi:pimeloyl-ACP methyl ester carboxylesterase
MLRRTLLALAALLAAALLLPPLWYALFPETRPELPPPGRRVEVAPGVGVNLIEAGDGPPLVLVHGHPGCAYDWAPLQRELAARGHRVLAYDRVGYGRSDGRPGGDYTVEANARELLALLEAEGLRDVTLVGWSYGGGTSIVAARRDPERIARLVLVGSVGPGIENREAPPRLVVEFMAGPGLTWLARVPPLARRLRAALTASAFDPDPVPPEFLVQLDANFGRPHTLTTFRSEGRDLGGEADLDPAPIDRRILVAHGDADRLVPLAVGRELFARARRGELRVVPGGSHMLPITHAAELADRIAAFVSVPHR